MNVGRGVAVDEGVGVWDVGRTDPLVYDCARVVEPHSSARCQDPGVLVRLVPGEDHVPALSLVNGVDVLELVDDGQRQVSHHEPVREDP